MTGAQKQAILRARAAGVTYSQIADKVGLPLNTVKSCCRRAGVSVSEDFTANTDTCNSCKNCGKTLPHREKVKPKKFCREACRRAYWKGRHKKIYPVACAHCGRAFKSYGNTNRKYCSRGCYIAARFGPPGKAVGA